MVKAIHQGRALQDQRDLHRRVDHLETLYVRTIPSVNEVLDESFLKRRQQVGNLGEIEREASPSKHVNFDIYSDAGDDESVHSAIANGDTINKCIHLPRDTIAIRGDWQSLPAAHWDVIHGRFAIARNSDGLFDPKGISIQPAENDASLPRLLDEQKAKIDVFVAEMRQQLLST